MIEYRLWEYGDDDHFIPSYIDTSFKAHNIKPRDNAWFHWKYEQSPYGKSIMACAFDGDVVCGCVAMGIGQMTYGDKNIKFALAYQNYVNKDYQRRGIFKKLIALVEEESRKAGVKLLYIFPNNNSLPGYKRMGYTELPPTKNYLKVLHPLKVAFNYSDLHKQFQNRPANVSELKSISIDEFKPIRKEGIFIPQWTAKYIKWRFLTYPVGNYLIYDDKDLFFVVRNGDFGKISCAQLLHIQPHNRELTRCDYQMMQRIIKRKLNPDILMIDSSEHYPLRKFLRGYIGAKTRGHFTYKFLTDEFDGVEFNLSKSGIDAHTY